MGVVVHLVSGLLFGLGLVVSGMVNPAKVLNFLDVAGSWDPSLAFVLGGAVITTFVGYRLVFMRSKPFFGDGFALPTAADVDLRLLLGATVFGTGWGLIGYCPGPAMTGLAFLQWPTGVFVLAMLAGMLGARLLNRA